MVNIPANAAPVPGGDSSLEPERQRALDAITSAFSTGSITLEEYEHRAGLIQNAKSAGEIAVQTGDLPQAAMPPADEMPADTRSEANPEPRRPSEIWAGQGGGSPEFVLSIMSERRMRGNWLNGNSAISFTLMGSTTLDLREVALPPGPVQINAVAIMGEIRIIVPEWLPVRMSAFPFMGEAKIHDDVNQRADRSETWVQVSGLAFMGSIVVRTR